MSAGRALNALAARCGIQRRYTDGTGQRRVASTDAVLAVLGSMGFDVRRPEEAVAELARLEHDQTARLIEPVVVCWNSDAPSVALSPGCLSHERIEITLSKEHGHRHTWSVRSDELDASGGGGPRTPLPGAVADGIHELTVQAGGRDESATLLVAPSRCFEPSHDPEDPARGPELSLFLPLYAVRSESSFGVGSLGDLDRLASWAGGVGARTMGTLPLLSTFLDEPFEPSPYAPVSRAVFGELFLDVHDAGSRHELPTLRALLGSPEFDRRAHEARTGELVDYRASWALVRRCMEAAASDTLSSNRLREAVERFGRDDHLIGEYVRFRAERAAGPDARSPDAEGWMYLTAQWLLDEQLNRLASNGNATGCGLYLDLPVGAHRDGFDTWRAPGLHAPGVSMGAPPDELFRGGQDWGFPPVVPERSRQLGHRVLSDAIERHLRLASALRVDHAAGLHRSYWVPHGLGAADGVYVRSPAEEYYALLSILSHRHEARIIGENLGTIPRQVDRGLRRRGVLGMSIGQFELGAHADRPLPTPGPRSLASLNTHDMPPFAAHWTGEDVPLLAELGVLEHADIGRHLASRETMRARVVDMLRSRGLIEHDDTASVLDGLLRYLRGTDAAMLVVNIEDLWLETRPQNVPGIVDGYPSWRRRSAWELERIICDPRLRDMLGMLGANGPVSLRVGAQGTVGSGVAEPAGHGPEAGRTRNTKGR